MDGKITIEKREIRIKEGIETCQNITNISNMADIGESHNSPHSPIYLKSSSKSPTSS